MFHKIKNVSALPDYKLSVQFSEGVTKMYDARELIDKHPIFQMSQDEFYEVRVDVGGYGIIWNDQLDLVCDELWNNGITVVAIKSLVREYGAPKK